MTASAHRAVQRDIPPMRRPARVDQSRAFADDLLPDGSLVVPVDLCAAFGGGDASAGRRDLRNMLWALKERKLREPPAPRPANVRMAVQKDEDAAVALWKLDIAENAGHVAPLDEDRLRQHIRAGTDRQGGVVGLIDGPNGPEALSVLVACQWHWSRQYYWQDLCTFVHPNHRRSQHVHALLDFNEFVADEMSRLFGYRVYLLTGVLGTRRLWAKTALFRRRYRPVGASFIYPAVSAGGG